MTKFLFFTGKGGVGKTTCACATAVKLADAGKRVLIVSTDPASNLQDVFETELGPRPTPIPGVANLAAVNLDPIQAATAYRESVVAPYRGKLPEAAIRNMEEQLSGSCTIEIAAFTEFTNLLTDAALLDAYDHIVFDTAPTGHTLRMLQLPSAWTDFISTSKHGASCLGQLSGLESKKSAYAAAVDTLRDASRTTLFLVTRPEPVPLKEAARAARELAALGIANQSLIVNGVLAPGDDALSWSIISRQQTALAQLPEEVKALPRETIPLRTFNMTGLAAIRALFSEESVDGPADELPVCDYPGLEAVVEHLVELKKRVVFTMGKGGVGKTTVAAEIARRLAESGSRVFLTTTDPAAHLKDMATAHANLTVRAIDEQAELARYQSEVLAKAKASGLDADGLAYVEEDLRSPCTQEIAVFRAFAEVVAKADDAVVVIDTAPTGHTLLLLESTENYDREIRRTKGETPESVSNLLARLRGPETEVVIVSLPEATPVYEALRLEADLTRAQIPVGWWVMNRSLLKAGTTSPILRAKAFAEIPWIGQIDKHTKGRMALIEYLRGVASSQGRAACCSGGVCPLPTEEQKIAPVVAPEPQYGPLARPRTCCGGSVVN